MDERDMASGEDGTSAGGAIWETLRTVVIAVLIAVVVRTFAYEPFNIPSGSMKPTLLVGDYLFVSKFSYGFSRFSLPFGLPLFEGRIAASEPERGDVAVFRQPTDTTTDYIKRIVGLPGDKIQVKGGLLYINGEAVKREEVGVELAQNELGFPTTIKQYVETLPNGVTHNIWEYGDDEGLDNTDVYTVPAGHFFAMGDNRDRSQDSRVLRSVGFVPFENLVGRAEFLFFSHNGQASWWEVWKWHKAIRFGRLGNGID